MRLSNQSMNIRLYPDLNEMGGLCPALQAALTDINSPLHVSDRYSWEASSYARVESGNRFSQVYIASLERRFLFELWQDGVALAAGGTDSLKGLALSLNAWIEDRLTVGDLITKFPFISARDHAEPFEQGREVEWKWQYLRRTIPEDFPELVPFLNEAVNDPTLRQLFPFTSLNRFCFSRCTGYPYSGDCPIVTPRGVGLYKVTGPKQEFDGVGDAREAVRLVLKQLPDDCGPARAGTARDL